MKAVIALGANIGNPQENLDLAVALLREATDVKSVSTYYSTAPVGGPEQGDFLNAVAIGDCDLSAEQLLTELLKIEEEMGRVREIKWGPRIIDLDLIVYGNHSSNTDFLKLPLPLAHTRDFVLTPWYSIDPEAEIPGTGAIKTLLASLGKPS